MLHLHTMHRRQANRGILICLITTVLEILCSNCLQMYSCLVVMTKWYIPVLPLCHTTSMRLDAEKRIDILMSNNVSERSRWQPVKDIMQHADNVTLGKHISYWFRNSPRRALHSMSYYKFASRMIGQKKTVLDIGCGEGLGTWLLAKECGQATGIDLDNDAIRTASANWSDETISFIEDDFLTVAFSKSFDAVVNFDVIEHIHPDHIGAFLDKVMSILPQEGIF